MKIDANVIRVEECPLCEGTGVIIPDGHVYVPQEIEHQCYCGLCRGEGKLALVEISK